MDNIFNFFPNKENIMKQIENDTNKYSFDKLAILYYHFLDGIMDYKII